MFDAIVIGSGIGGLTTAALLTRMAGMRVLVLERSLEPGGCTRTFRRDGASWNVGLHHVGEMQPGTHMRSVSDVISCGELRWNRLSEDFQRLVYPNFEFQVPANRAEFRRRLLAEFPEEAAAIRRYVKDVRRTAQWARLSFSVFLVPERARPFLELARRPRHRLATMTTREYLEQNFHSPQLKAVLATQWGDYSFPPASGSFQLHSLFVDHLLEGAWFPEGGSSRIARTIEAVIEAGGGEVRVGCEVAKILLENGRAVGVEVIDGRGPLPRLVAHRADFVVSSAGVAATYGQLLPQTEEVIRATGELQRRFADIGPRHDAVSLLLRLKESPVALGASAQDVWVHSDLDEADSETYTRRLLAGIPSRCQVSFPSLKSGDCSSHTAEIIAFAPPEAFRRWEGLSSGNRGPGYEALKFRIGQGLLRLAETALPGLTDLTDYLELTTPLTAADANREPCNALRSPKAPEPRHRSSLLGPRTPFPGLFLTGQDAGSIGFGGAMMGGVTAAAQIIGPRCWPEVLRLAKDEQRLRQPPMRTHPLPQGKYRARFLSRRQFTPTVWEITLDLEAEAPHFVAGQFARIQVGPWEWRDHCIVSLQENRLRLLVSTRSRGIGSRFLTTSPIGTPTLVQLPLGAFTLRESRGKRVFAATGTGIAPFLAMFEEMGEELADATLIHGCHSFDRDLADMLDFTLPPTVIRCHDREQPSGALEGRISDVLSTMPLDIERTEFYLCGSAEMVADCALVLRERGAREEIYHERF